MSEYTGYVWVHNGEAVTESELDRLYEDMLDDIYGAVNIGGYEYETSDALKQVDPIAYRCGRNDYVDSLVREGDMIMDEEDYREAYGEGEED